MKELEKKPYSYQCNTCKFKNNIGSNDWCEKGDWHVEKDDNDLMFIPSVKECEKYVECSKKAGKERKKYKKWVSSQHAHYNKRVKLKHELRRKGIAFSKEDPTCVLEAKLKDGGFMGFTGD